MVFGFLLSGKKLYVGLLFWAQFVLKVSVEVSITNRKRTDDALSSWRLVKESWMAWYIFQMTLMRFSGTPYLANIVKSAS